MFRISAAASLFQSGAARRLVGGTIWSATGEALARGSMLLSLILAARILGSAGYGELGLLRTTVATFTTLGGTFKSPLSPISKP